MLEDIYKDIDNIITEAAQQGHTTVNYFIKPEYMEYLPAILKEYEEFHATHYFSEPDYIYPGNHYIKFNW